MYIKALTDTHTCTHVHTHPEGVWALQQAPQGRGHSTNLTELMKLLNDALGYMV